MPKIRSVPRFVRILGIASAILLSPLAEAAPADSASALAGKSVDQALIAQDIAGAGRLRMQSQRLAKLYQQAGMGMNASVAVRQMSLASSEFDADFVRLARYGKKSTSQRVYARCETVWHELRELLKNQANAATAERVNQLADELMLHTGKLAMVIEADAETPVGRLLDLSSRLNMLAQRLARLYLMAQVGDKSQGVLTDIEQARKEFSTGLRELDSARENSPASRQAISLAKNQWIFFDLAIQQLGSQSQRDSKAMHNVATSSERIAQMLDDVGAQYVRDYAQGLRPAKP